MKHFFTIYLLIIIFWGGLSAQSPRHSACTLRSTRVETGKVIVKLQPDAVPMVETRLQTLRKLSSDTSTLNIGIRSFDQINRRYRASAMRRVFPDAGEYEAKHRKYGLHLWYEITIPESEDPETAATGYGANENVQIADPRYKIRRFSMPAPTLPLAEEPNDPNFNKQWNYLNTGQTGGTPGADIRLTEAWERVKLLGIRNNNVIVAVMDDGVYHDHEDLKTNMWINEAELNGIKGIDDDKNGYVDDIYGYNFVGRTGTIAPEQHGTHVAGTIAAVTGNGIGVSGIAGNPADGYGIKIMTVQIFSGDKSVSSIGPAFAYAADNGAVISQNSWGYDDPDVYNPSDVAAINYFINEAGRDKNGNPRPGTPMVGGIVIFAAGNDGKNDKWYPAYFNNVLAVAATNHYGKRAWYSNFGSWVDISAPGGDTNEIGKNRTGGIYSTSYRATNKNYYEYMQGTSMACPHVSGVAALILSVYGNECYTPEMLRTQLLSTATPLIGFDPTYASTMGAGLVNAAAALAQPTSGMPDQIIDLTAQTINAVSCLLNWTAPQISNNGKASYYTIACASEQITEANFNQYAQLPAGVMQMAGTSQQTTITGLHPEKSYYVAIRSSDNQCNTSAISNVETFTTMSNSAPVVSNPLPDITLRDVAKETAFFVGDVFTDSDGDEMTYEIDVASQKIATARVMDNSILIKPLLAGETKLTLTADDGSTGRTSFIFSLMVTQNHAPVFNRLLPDITLLPFTVPVAVHLNEYAIDPDGDPIMFTIQNDADSIVTTSMIGSAMILSSQRHGQTTLQITASDPYAAKITTTIGVTVEQKYAPKKPKQLLVYPNPTSDILWYSYILNEPASVSVRMINSVGQTMFQTSTEKLSDGAHYYNIDISGWSSGVYIVQFIKDGKMVDVKKVVKL